MCDNFLVKTFNSNLIIFIVWINVSDVVSFQKTCQDNEIANDILKNVNASWDDCFPAKLKVILIVIDALKYDFGSYNAALENPQSHENISCP